MSFKTIYILALRYRAGATAGLAEMEVVMLESARFHTNSQWEKLEQCYLLYRAASSKLGVLSLEKGLTRWRQRPKSHSLEHGVYDFWKANMRYMANYLDEDFVRRSKQLAIKASPKYVSRHVLFRYSIAATLRWTQMLPEWTSKIEDFDLIWVRWCLVFGIQNACFEEVYKELDIHPRPTFGDFWECWTVQFQAKTLKQLRPNSTLSKYTVYLFPKHLWKLVPKRVWFGNIVWKFASKRFGYKYIYSAIPPFGIRVFLVQSMSYFGLKKRPWNSVFPEHVWHLNGLVWGDRSEIDIQITRIHYMCCSFYPN